MKKIIAITGANSGIGYQIAKELLLKDHFVILFCRTKQKYLKTKKQLILDTKKEEIDFFSADFSSFKEVRQAGELFQKKYSTLDILINNAGGTFSEFKLTEDGNETTMQVNHLSPFLLTFYLLDALKNTENTRIINTSSIANFDGDILFDKINSKKHFHILKNYSDSKLANILFTYKLAEKLKKYQITVNCLHPGIVKTKIGDKSGNWFHKKAWQLFTLFKGISIEKGAETSIYLADSEEVTGLNSKYFVRKKETESAEKSYNKKLQEKLWHWSEEKTSIHF